MQGSISLSRIKEVSIQLAMVGIGVAVCALAHAQNRVVYHDYQGQRPKMNRNDPRKDVYESCKAKYLKRGIPADVFATCVDSIKDSEGFSRADTTASGCENGFYTGFSSGLYYGSNDYANNDGEFRLGLDAGRQRAQDMVDLDNARNNGRLMQSASNAGWNKGNTDGDGTARADWVNSLDRGIPNPNPRPEKDLKFAGSEFGAPYGQLVGQPLSLEQMVVDHQYDINTFALYRKNNRRSRICRDGTWTHDRNGIRGGTYYRKDGIFGTDRNSAINGQGGLDRWLGTRDGSARARALQGKKIEVAADQIGDQQQNDQKPQQNSGNGGGRGDQNTNNHGGKGDQNGGNANNGGTKNPSDTAGTKGAPAPTGEPQKPATPPVVFDLWQIYMDNFRSGFAYYGKDFYDDGFDDMLDDGSNDGYGYGMNIGLEYSRQQGRVTGFDGEFRNQEFLTYNRAYQNQYITKYGQTFQHYQTTPVVRAQLLDIVETVKDGIFQPGEPIKAIYKLINYGGVPANVTAQLQGNGIESTNEAKAVIPAATSKNVADGVLTANLNSQLGSLQNAQILLVVAGGEEVQTSAIERTVTRQVTLDNSVTYVPLAPAGVVQVSLTVRNQSPMIPTSDDVTVIATDNKGNKSLATNLGILAKSEVRPAMIEIKGIDPLSLYLNQVSFSVQVFKGKTLIAQSQVIGVSHNEATEMADLAQIFDDAAHVPAKLAQAKAAKTQLVKEIEAETSDVKNNRYKNPEGTLVNEVLKAYRRTAQTNESKALYRELASEIRGFSKKLRALGGIFGKKGEKAYLAMVDELAK